MIRLLKTILKYFLFIALFIKHNIIYDFLSKRIIQFKRNVYAFDVRKTGRFIPYLWEAILHKAGKLIINYDIPLSSAVSLFYLMRKKNVKVEFYKNNITRECVLITDQTNRLTRSVMNTINIDYKYFSRKMFHNKSIVMPFYMHPKIYNSGLHKERNRPQKNDRNIVITFAGTANVAAYVESFGFDMLNRNEIISYVTEEFGEKTRVISDRKTFLQARNERADILLIVTNKAKNSLRKHILSLKEYLEILSQSDFFLALPGVKIPQSHNAIEAMSVGAIPILNYSEYFEPQLVHMENCIAFSSKRDLKQKIDSVLHMSISKKKEMREKVLHYYDTVLSPWAFSKELYRDSENTTLYVCASNLSV